MSWFECHSKFHPKCHPEYHPKYNPEYHSECHPNVIYNGLKLRVVIDQTLGVGKNLWSLNRAKQTEFLWTINRPGLDVELSLTMIKGMISPYNMISPENCIGIMPWSHQGRVCH